MNGYSNKLTGFRPIRVHLGIEVPSLSPACGHTQNLHRIDRCEQGATLGITTAIAHALCCKSEDLQSQPSEARLAEILIAYRERQLEEARAAAAPAAAGGEA